MHHEQLTERLRPQALMPERVGLAHALIALFAGSSALGLAALAVTHLPTGLALLLVIVPLAVWAWLSVRAWRANRTLGALYRRGHVVRGAVTALSADAQAATTVHYRYHVLPEALDAEALAALDEASLDAFVHEGCVEGLSRWAAVRYRPQMQVAVLFEPGEPERSTLIPPPAGGTPLDVVGDVFAAILRRLPDGDSR